MSLVVTTAPTVEPVTVDDLKGHLNVTTDDDDAYIGSLAVAARRAIEAYQNRALVNTTFTWKFDSLYCTLDHRGKLRPPRSKLSSVTSITYIDTNGDTQTLATSVYGVDASTEPGRIYLKYAQNWPSDVRDIEDCWTVVFVAGYGADATSVPDETKQAIKMLAAHWYENREPVNIGNITSELPFGPLMLANVNRIVEFP